MPGEEYRTHEGNHLGQSDGTQRQRGVGSFILGQAIDLPGDGHVLNLDSQRAEDDRRQIKAERAGGDGGSGCLRGGGHRRHYCRTGTF